MSANPKLPVHPSPSLLPPWQPQVVFFLCLWVRFCFVCRLICVCVILLFIFDCSGSLWQCGLFSSCGEQGPLSSCGAWASHVVGPLVVGHRLEDSRSSVAVAPRLQSTGSVVVGFKLSCSAAWGIFPDKESSLCSGGFFTTEPPGKSVGSYYRFHI